MADDRLARLRALIAQLERSPASAQRDWTLAETRRRLADLQTGHATEPMRPFDTDTPQPRTTPPPVRRARPGRVVKPEPPAAPPHPRLEAPQPTVTPVADGEILWLDRADDDDPPAEDPGGAPWRRGLRG
jgi:hypothetical protein